MQQHHLIKIRTTPNWFRESFNIQWDMEYFLWNGHKSAFQLEPYIKELPLPCTLFSVLI
jgi:hypothetical protein